MTGRQCSLERLSHRWEGVLGRVVRASSSSRFARRGRRFGRRRFFNFRHRRVLIGASVVLLFLLVRAILIAIFCFSLIITGGGDCRRRSASRRCNAVLRTERSVKSSLCPRARLLVTYDSQLWRTRVRPVNVAQGGIVFPRVVTAIARKASVLARSLAGSCSTRSHAHDAQWRILCMHIFRFWRSGRLPLALFALLLARCRLSPIFRFRLLSSREQALLARGHFVPGRRRRRESRRGGR